MRAGKFSAMAVRASASISDQLHLQKQSAASPQPLLKDSGLATTARISRSPLKEEEEEQQQ